MSAAERLDDIEIRLASPMVTYKENATEDVPALVAALRAVLDLHRPVTHRDSGTERTVCGLCAALCHSESGLLCDDDGDGTYPCATVAAITAALGGAR